MGRNLKARDETNEVRQLCELLGLSFAALAAEAKVSAEYLSQVERGARPITDKMRRTLQAVRIRHGLVASPWTRDEAEVMQLYRQLPAEGRATAIDVIRALAGAAPSAPTKAAKQ